MSRIFAVLAVGLLAGLCGAHPAAADPGAEVPVLARATPPEAAPAVAARILNYQGRFTDLSGTALPGPVKLVFRLYDAPTGGANLWTEIHDIVALVDGVASVLLGSRATFPGNAFQTEGLYLGIAVDDGDELTPRLRIVSVPVALEAESLQGKEPADFEPKGAVIALSINDGSPPNSGQNRVHWNVLTGVPEGFLDGEDTGVTAHDELSGLTADDHPQYAQEADLVESEGSGPNTGKNLVHWENLTGVPSGFADGADNTGAGSTDHGDLTGLADDDHPQYATDAELDAHEAAVNPHPGYATTTDVDNHAGIPGAHHPKTVDAAELVAGELDPARIPAGAVTGARIADGAVAAEDLAPGAVTGVAVTDGSLTGLDLAVGSVDGDRLTAGSVGADRLAPGTADSTFLADGGVSQADLAPGSVDSLQLAPGSVTAGAVRDGSLTSADIQNGSILAVDLMNGTGIEQGGDAGRQSLSGSGSSVLTQDIFCPDSGWVLALATGQGCIQASTTGGEHTLFFSVSGTENTLDPDAETAYQVFGLLGVNQCAPLVSQKLFTVSAGLNTFHIVAGENANGSVDVSRLQLSLIYFGTRY